MSSPGSDDGAQGRIEALLQRIERGDKEASDELAGLVHGELHTLAQRFMADQPGGHTLQPTALVNEAWMRLAAGRMPEGRAHFLRVAAASMRSILVDHARRRAAEKRGGGRPVRALEEVGELGVEGNGAGLLVLHEVLERLGNKHPEAAQVAEMRLFAGLEHVEVAGVLGLSPRSVDRLWKTARLWLQRELDFE